MSKTSEQAAQVLAQRIERKFQDRSWKDMIRRAEKKGALVEETIWQPRERTVCSCGNPECGNPIILCT